MTEDRNPKATEEAPTSTGAVRQRKKRKWDQPAESLVAAGLALPGALPLGMSASQLFQSSAVVQKLMQPKIQDELIAREITINDAEPTIRYKLTKRQTQEEIQKFTGAVVITRGKYRPPNGQPDSEKPLYLHISAGAHLKETAERIKAVDCAASMVEEILKQGSSPLRNSTHELIANSGPMIQPFSMCVFLGFDTDPSVNIAARIRGPNDQYINHIMNETGASVVLRGPGFSNSASAQTEETQQPLHLYLSSTNQKSLEHARILAENLLDTICAEFGSTRISSCKVYGAVPPPRQFMNGNILGANTNLVAGLPCTASGFTAAATSFAPSSFHVSPGNMLQQSGGLPSYLTTQATLASYARPVVTSGTCYSGYGGIYPQTTPLQQVALALRHAPASTTLVVASTTEPAGIASKNTTSSSSENDRRPHQRRKFQELPVTSKDRTTLNQNLPQDEFLKPGLVDTSVRNSLSMSPPKKFISPGSDDMPQLPTRNMPPPPSKLSAPHSPPRAESGILVAENLLSRNMHPPPPKFSTPQLFSGASLPIRNFPPQPPKFSAPQSPPKADHGNPAMKKSIAQPIPDTLLKLVEYGEEDDDIDPSDVSSGSHPTWNAAPKPFWAV